jgi:hypothetical protein
MGLCGCIAPVDCEDWGFAGGGGAASSISQGPLDFAGAFGGDFSLVRLIVIPAVPA